MKLLLLFIFILAGCNAEKLNCNTETIERKCINNKVHIRNGNVWIEVYQSMPCYPVKDSK